MSDINDAACFVFVIRDDIAHLFPSGAEDEKWTIRVGLIT